MVGRFEIGKDVARELAESAADEEATDLDG